jgi:hypothetical protein
MDSNSNWSYDGKHWPTWNRACAELESVFRQEALKMEVQIRQEALEREVQIRRDALDKEVQINQLTIELVIERDRNRDWVYKATLLGVVLLAVCVIYVGLTRI